jgi:hypothetical protein
MISLLIHLLLDLVSIIKVVKHLRLNSNLFGRAQISTGNDISLQQIKSTSQTNQTHSSMFQSIILLETQLNHIMWDFDVLEVIFFLIFHNPKTPKPQNPRT